MNYAQLTAALISYTETTDQSFIDNIPTFVQQAEERIYNSVNLLTLRKNVTGTMTSGNKYITLPADWLATYSVARINPDNSQEFLLDKDVNYIRQVYPQPSDTGAPKFYALFDAATLIVGPTPNDDYGVELHYFYYPESIVTAGTSWLGENFETALFYGSLREAYLFQKGEQDLIANVEQKYNESLALLKRLGDGLNRQDTYRDGQLRIPPT